jgi:hypothetical protein
MTNSSSSWARGGWSQDYYISYYFEAVIPDGSSEVYTQEKLIGKDLYDQLKPGDRIAIQYVPTNPQNSRIL